MDRKVLEVSSFSLFFSDYLPTYLFIDLSIYLSLSLHLSISHLSIYLFSASLKRKLFCEPRNFLIF